MHARPRWKVSDMGQEAVNFLPAGDRRDIHLHGMPRLKAI